MTEKFLQNNNLRDPDDIDSLVELASLVRELAESKQCIHINRIICYTLEQGYYEAFSWCMEILQEVLEKKDSALDNFDCILGKSIPGYDEFVERLQVDFQACENELETVCDSRGEVESFYNILVYKTGYKNIFFVSSENFDTKNNDFVNYRLSFLKG